MGNVVEETVVASVQTSVAESVESVPQRAMERFATLEIGTAKGLCLHWHRASVLHEKADDQEQMMDQEKVFGNAGLLLPLSGAKVVLKALKRDRDLLDVNSRSDHHLLQLPRSRIVNGVRRCDLTLHRPSLQHHLAMAVRLLHPRPLGRLFQLDGPS